MAAALVATNSQQWSIHVSLASRSCRAPPGPVPPGLSGGPVLYVPSMISGNEGVTLVMRPVVVDVTMIALRLIRKDAVGSAAANIDLTRYFYGGQLISIEIGTRS